MAIMKQTTTSQSENFSFCKSTPHIISLVIPNFRPFRSICYPFRNKNFFQIAKSPINRKHFYKIFNCNPCDTQIFVRFALTGTISYFWPNFKILVPSDQFVVYTLQTMNLNLKYCVVWPETP